MPKQPEYTYLIYLINRISNSLKQEGLVRAEIADVIVSFCICSERLLKIKLYRKNPLLVFEPRFIRDDNIVSAVALKKEVDTPTAQLETVIARFAIIFPKIFTPDELELLAVIYRTRNEFTHTCFADDSIEIEEMIIKISTLWGPMNNLAIQLFGKNKVKSSKSKKVYTEKELEKALEDEVRKMITPTVSQRFDFGFSTRPRMSVTGSRIFMGSDEFCPRCGQYSLQRDDGKDRLPFMSISSLDSSYPYGDYGFYKCIKCNLELTPKQYEIAEKIRRENNELARNRLNEL